MKKTIIKLMLLLLIFVICFLSCQKDKACDFNNPLTDLPWLKTKINEINLLYQENPTLSVAIYQCAYGNGKTGFLVDEGNIKLFHNCNGDILCIMGGIAGETCSELNIVSEELIWEINN
jgi:hypothetical protein